jgi:hypothetical protein
VSFWPSLRFLTQLGAQSAFRTLDRHDAQFPFSHFCSRVHEILFVATDPTRLKLAQETRALANRVSIDTAKKRLLELAKDYDRIAV